MSNEQHSAIPAPPHWQQIAAYLLHKFTPGQPVEITAADVESFIAAYAPSIPIVFVDQRDGKFKVSIITEAEAMKLSREPNFEVQTVGGEPMAPSTDTP